jgi:NAD(P)H-dependent flavin oxidoreductase YrpB (nitropropane dioxygenase family)
MGSSNNSRRSFLRKAVLGAAIVGVPSILKAEDKATKTLKTQLTKDYGFTVPIISAGMAFVANADLAIAVSKTGALGQMSGSGFPVDYLKSQIQKIKTELKGNPYGINFIPRFINIAHIEVCIAEKVPVVVFFWDDVPAQYMKRLKENKVKVWIQIGSLAEGKSAASAGADALIVQGYEAGGHNRSTASAFSLLPNIKKALPHMPLIAAGGIADGQGLAAALTLGADAVSVGTRFLATPESNAHPEYKKRVVAAEVHDTVHHNIFGFDFPDATVRGIRNKIVAEYEGKDYPAPYADKKPEDFPIIGHSAMGPIRRFSGVLPTPETTGDFEQMSLLAGESVGLINDIKPAAEIVSQMVKEAKVCLSKF